MYTVIVLCIVARMQKLYGSSMSQTRGPIVAAMWPAWNRTGTAYAPTKCKHRRLRHIFVYIFQHYDLAPVETRIHFVRDLFKLNLYDKEMEDYDVELF